MLSEILLIMIKKSRRFIPVSFSTACLCWTVLAESSHIYTLSHSTVTVIHHTDKFLLANSFCTTCTANFQGRNIFLRKTWVTYWEIKNLLKNRMCGEEGALLLLDVVVSREWMWMTDEHESKMWSLGMSMYPSLSARKNCQNIIVKKSVAFVVLKFDCAGNSFESVKDGLLIDLVIHYNCDINIIPDITRIRLRSDD